MMYPLNLTSLFHCCLKENDFLKDALMIPWTLSTSQQPQQQIPDVPDCNDPKFNDMVHNRFTRLQYLDVNVKNFISLVPLFVTKHMFSLC